MLQLVNCLQDDYLSVTQKDMNKRERNKRNEHFNKMLLDEGNHIIKHATERVVREAQIA